MDFGLSAARSTKSKAEKRNHTHTLHSVHKIRFNCDLYVLNLILSARELSCDLYQIMMGGCQLSGTFYAFFSPTITLIWALCARVYECDKNQSKTN